jgi:hypothetical protein
VLCCGASESVVWPPNAALAMNRRDYALALTWMIHMMMASTARHVLDHNCF